MVTPTIGAVVLVRFPFSDLTAAKLRPAVVLADVTRGDWILCQITSQPYTDTKAIPIATADFTKGSLKKDSYVRPSKLFTANAGIIVRGVGELSREKRTEILRAVAALFKES